MNYFLDIEEQYRTPGATRYDMLLVPYDATSTWQKGADRGPEAIVDASCHVELYDLETDCEAYTAGISTNRPEFDFSSPQAMVQSVRRQVSAILEQGAMPIVVGGEHSVSVGAVQAAAGKFTDLTVLQLDAHADLRNEYNGSPLNHACAMARIKEMCPLVQVGIRSMDRTEISSIAAERFFPAHAIHDNSAWVQKALAALSQNVYITIDLDVFDPGIMPATGTPEPGGLSWYPVLSFLRRVISGKNLVGFDVVELCPGDNPHPDFLAARLIYKIISYHHLKEMKEETHEKK
jgi:agmatinase